MYLLQPHMLRRRRTQIHVSPFSLKCYDVAVPRSMCHLSPSNATTSPDPDPCVAYVDNFGDPRRCSAYVSQYWEPNMCDDIIDERKCDEIYCNISSNAIHTLTDVKKRMKKIAIQIGQANSARDIVWYLN